jgi:hypothetical protein
VSNDRTRQRKQHTSAQHSTAQHSTPHHTTLLHSTAQHSTAQHSTAQHSTAQHSTAQHSTAQHSTAQHSTAQENTRTNITSHVKYVLLWFLIFDTEDSHHRHSVVVTWSASPLRFNTKVHDKRKILMRFSSLQHFLQNSKQNSFFQIMAWDYFTF